ncbi:MAG: hypothetical protein JXB49_24675 [Bacteroidales bacterium]|nr:hypothetical protein [Bacteroidales bacterium]
MNSLEEFLSQIAHNLSTEFGVDCIFQYSNIDGYNTDIAMKIQLPSLLKEMDLELEDVLNDNYYLCTIAVEIDDSENILSRINNAGVKVSVFEDALRKMVNTHVKPFGLITKEDKKYQTIKFLLRYKNEEIQKLENMINNHAYTKVKMKGKLDDNGFFSGTLVGSTTDELYAFIAFIAKKRNEAFERVNIRYRTLNPKTYDCAIKFDTNALKSKRGFFKKLFG